MEIDDYDINILKHIQQDARISFEALGELVGLSTASVHRRIKRLRNSKVIQSEITLLDAKQLNIGMTMVVNIEMERERSDLLNAFKQRISEFAEVQQCYYVTGNSDFVLIVKVRDLEHYERFTQSAFFDNSNVKKFSTSVVMGEVKVGLSLPI